MAYDCCAAERSLALLVNCYKNQNKQKTSRQDDSNSQIPDSKKPAQGAGFLVFGALDRIRTCDRSVRSRVLYPAELRVHLCLLDQTTAGYRKVTCMTANNS